MPVLQFDAAGRTGRADQLLGLLRRSRSSRPHAGLRLGRRPAGRRCDEFRDMVKALHRAGIEVILDVVFNHTAEGDETGPTLSFRGLDNAVYYMLDGDRPLRRTTRAAATPSTRNHPVVRRHHPRLPALLGRPRCTSTASASTWPRSSPATPTATPDGEPAGALGHRERPGPGRHQAHRRGLGRGRPLPGGPLRRRRWAEWNGKFRDDVRRFVRGDAGTRVALAPTGCSASPDLFGGRQREPEHSINFVTCHDGFTLNDLVSYDAQAQRGQRREATATATNDELSAGTAASRGRPTIRRSSGCATGR